MGFWDEEAFEDGGGGISTFEGTITDAYFSENDYGASLRITSMFDHGELFPDKPDGTYTQFYSLGQNAREWKVEGDGATVAHQTGDPNKKARKDSDLGRLGEAFRALDGLREARPDFNPYAAASYQGLHLEWRRTSYEVNRYKRDDAGNKIAGPDGKDLLEPVTKYIMLPVALIGAESSNGAGVDVNSLGLDTPTLVALATMANATDDATFMVEIAKGYSSNKALMTAVTKDTEGTRQALADAII